MCDNDKDLKVCFLVTRVRYLLDCGCDVSASKFNGWTAFHRAVVQGSMSCVKTFVEYGIQVDCPDWGGRTALHMAADQGHHAILKYLIQSGSDPNILDQELQSPLFECTMRGHIECVRMLVASGGLTGIQNQYGNTPIITASILGKSDVLRLLLRLIGNVNKTGFKKLTALHCASLHGHRDCVEMLLDKMAAINKQAQDGATAAHLIIKSPKHRINKLDVLEVLVYNNCDLELKALNPFDNGSALKKRYVTCFELAVTTGQFYLASWLSLCGANMKIIKKSKPSQIWPDAKNSIKDKAVLWLIDQASHPRPLMEICKLKIRRTIGQGIQNALLKIHLPRTLKDYIGMKNIQMIRNLIPGDEQ